MNFARLIVLLALYFCVQVPMLGQLTLTRQAAVDSALAKNPQILSSIKNVLVQKAERRGSAYFDKTEIYMEAPTANFFTIGVQQNLMYPGVYFQDRNYKKQAVELAEKEVDVNRNQIGKNAELLYLNLQFTVAKNDLLLYQDSIYGNLVRATNKRYSVGDAAYLEKVLEETRQMEVRNLLMQNFREMDLYEQQLLLITGIESDSIVTDMFRQYENYNQVKDTSVVISNPLASYQLSNIKLNQYNFKLQRSIAFPNFFVGYLNQGLRNSDIIHRFRFGIGVPIFFTNYGARIRGARIGINVAELQYKSTLMNLKLDYLKAYSDLKRNEDNLKYYQETALKQSDEIIRSSNILFNAGEITYFVYLQGLSQAMSIKMAHLEALKNYNISVIELKYLRGQ